MKEWLQRNRTHIFFCLLILLSILVVHYKLVLEPNKIYAKHDILGYEYINLQELGQQLRQGEFPLWTNQIFGGTPFFAQPQVITAPHIVVLAWLLYNNTQLLINLGTLLNVLIAGLAMYYLMLRLKVEPRFAFISALVFMFSGQGLILTLSWFTRQTTIIFTPLVFLFAYLALYDDKGMKQAIADALLAALFLTFQFHTGGIDYALFMILMFLGLGLVYLIGKQPQKRVLRLGIVGAVIGVAFLGLFAMKLLPLTEFGEVSSKSQGFDFDSWRGQHIEIENPGDFFQMFVTPYLTRFDVGTTIGLIGLLLLLLTLPRIRRRPVLTFWVILVIAILFTVGFKPFLYPFYKFVPGMDKLHHVARAAYILQFAAAALAGFGASYLFEKLKEKNVRKTVVLGLYWLVALLIVIELGFIESRILKPGKVMEPNDWSRYDFREELDANQMMQYLGQQEGIFRVNHFSHSSICGIALNHLSYHGLEPLYGCFSVWIPEYFNVYLSVAYQDPARLKGMLNTKYFFEDAPLNVSGLKLVKTFPPCETCWQNPMDGGALDGPYLYENEQVLPRAYLASNGILVAGPPDRVRGIAYTLLLHPDFSPVDAAIIMHEGSMDDISSEELSRFNAIILTETPSPTAAQRLKSSADKGGLVLPDIFNGQQDVSQEELSAILTGFSKSYSQVKEIPITKYTDNSRTLRLKGEKGFLVLAEKFFLFEGWNPKIDGKTLPIVRANGINSAVYLDGQQGDLVFKYKPKSFLRGTLISVLTLLVMIGYFFWLKRGRSKPRLENEIERGRLDTNILQQDTKDL